MAACRVRQLCSFFFVSHQTGSKAKCRFAPIKSSEAGGDEAAHAVGFGVYLLRALNPDSPGITENFGV